jgi:hypothetical protein
MGVMGKEEHIYYYFLEQGVHTTESEYDENGLERLNGCMERKEAWLMACVG